jgi:hypothetical protein
MHYISNFLILAGLFITTFIHSQNLPLQNPTSSEFTAPLDIRMLLSSNYGEFRPNHFHAGIDFKTEQVEGKNVLSADAGSVSRIVVLGGGYGNAVYLKHPSGLITVYCHLSRFEPTLERYVKEQQYRKKSFEVDLYPAAGLFTFHKGELIGLSGNSGTSGGAHLHFEVRDRSGSIPLNPLNYGFAIKDKTNPEIKWLMIYPLDAYSSVNGTNQKMLVQVKGNNGNYFITSDTVKVNGKIGIGIETYDYLDNSLNECGPYTLSLTLDISQLYYCRIDSIPFSSTGYINSYFDYEEIIRSGKKIQKLFIDPNNQLKIYKVAINRGIIQLKDSAVHAISIVVKDTYGNSSILNFNLRSAGITGVPQSREKDSTVVARFAYDSLNVYESPDIRVALPRNALFDNIDFQYAKFNNDSMSFSAIHQVHNEYTPLFRSFILSVKPRDLPESLYAKALIANRATNGTWVSQGGEYKNGFVTARVKVFGKFIVTIDTLPPDIRPLAFKAGGRYIENQIISFNITDSLSGIRKYAGYIDKKWALFEYDAKNDLLTYTIDGTKLDKNRIHPMEIFIADNKDNVARYRTNFYY